MISPAWTTTNEYLTHQQESHTSSARKKVEGKTGGAVLVKPWDASPFALGVAYSFYVTGHGYLWLSLVNPAGLIVVQTVIKEHISQDTFP